MHFVILAVFSAKVKHPKSLANRAKKGGRVHFDFFKKIVSSVPYVRRFAVFYGRMPP